MPFTALYCLAASLVVAVLFIVILRKRGLGPALVLSILGLIALSAIFFALASIALNNM